MSSAATLIRRSRHAAGLTQSQLAARAGTSQSVIARLEREGANPRLSTLEKVIAAAGKSLVLSANPGPGIDETMIAANLRMTPTERLRAFAAAYRGLRKLAPTVREHGS